MDWTVDYGEGPQPCTVPHAWRQDVDVRWEGPAVYATTVEVPAKGGWLVFDGVSYAARVFIEGKLVLEHFGIWDAFSVELRAFRGSKVAVSVEVVKNGGSTYPVKDVLSGFLPYVFNTFGGIWREVWLSEDEPNLEPVAPPCRVSVKGTKIFVDKKPFYLRGVLTWGWYPELGHPNPSDEEIGREVKIAKELGFNTIKFCLWVPSHRYFEILEEEGMFAWLELPLWDPSPDPALQEKMFEEMERIVLQYRRHSNIVVWTCGCELSSNTTADFRKRLYEMVKELTGAALVKDNSGSSEMYGGDLREYGDFYDFHPYCDLPFYPVVLDSLLIGPREKKPILLGEFNDIDVHRDLARIKKEQPYWASSDPYLNDQGVRWEKPQLPRILEESRWAESGNNLLGGSLSKAHFIRQFVQSAVRSLDDIAGYVVTGWSDTPISSSGILDDWGQIRGTEQIKRWNAEVLVFPIPSRKPPWVAGGNRPGWMDPFCFFAGDVHLRIGVHSCSPLGARFCSSLSGSVNENGDLDGLTNADLGDVQIGANDPRVLGEVFHANLEAGVYGQWTNSEQTIEHHPLWVFDRPDFGRLADWRLDDPGGHFFGLKLPDGENVLAVNGFAAAQRALAKGRSNVLILIEQATKPAPFWRESAIEVSQGTLREKDWAVFFSVSGDRVIDLSDLADFLPGIDDVEVIINRIDTRTYSEAPILIRARLGKGTLVATTLRPFGGLGAQPYGVMNNPAGAHLLERLIELAEEK